MTPCIEGPTKPIPGADHKKPVTHWRLAPGQAWRATPEGWESAPVSAQDCKRAQYTYCLVWIRGATAAVFTIDGSEYAQPTKEIKPARQPRAHKPAPGVKPPLAHSEPDEEGVGSKPKEVRPDDAPRRRRKPLALLPLKNS